MWGVVDKDAVSCISGFAWMLARVIMMTMTRRQGLVAALVGLSLVVAVALGVWFWGVLVDYVDPKDTTARKDVVQVFALIVAGVVGVIGAAVGLANVYFSRKNLEQQRSLESKRAQDEIEQAYYKQIGEMLTEQELRNSEVNDDIRLLAEAHTVTVLRAIGPRRKVQLILFLERAQLIHKDDQLVNLTRADLRHVDLSKQVLMEADLSYADLSHADLRGADLSGAVLDSYPPKRRRPARCKPHVCRCRRIPDGRKPDKCGPDGRRPYPRYRSHRRTAALDALTYERHHAQRPEVRRLAQRQRRPRGG
jgi:hypothetical protein